MKAKNLIAKLAVGLVLAASAWTGAFAQGYPNKPIRLIVPFSAGGSTDVVARILGQRLSEDLGQPVIVDNRAGANTIIGADAVAKAAPDGYTLLVSIDNTWAMNQFLYDKLPYRPIEDFEPIAKLATIPIFLIASPRGPSSFSELVKLAKAKPGQVVYGFGAITAQLGGELLKSALGVDMQAVPYKGSAGVLQGLLSSDVDFGIDTIAAEKAHIQTGKLKLLANMGRNQLAGVNAPIVADEIGNKNIDVAFWLGMAAPRGTPVPIIDRLNSSIQKAVRSPEYLEAMAASGLISDYQAAEPFKRFISSQAIQWGPVIKAAGIKIQ